MMDAGIPTDAPEKRWRASEMRRAEVARRALGRQMWRDMKRLLLNPPPPPPPPPDCPWFLNKIKCGTPDRCAENGCRHQAADRAERDALTIRDWPYKVRTVEWPLPVQGYTGNDKANAPCDCEACMAIGKPVVTGVDFGIDDRTAYWPSNECPCSACVAQREGRKLWRWE